jgi:hypothetical protein
MFHNIEAHLLLTKISREFESWFKVFLQLKFCMLEVTLVFSFWDLGMNEWEVRYIFVRTLI